MNRQNEENGMPSGVIPVNRETPAQRNDSIFANGHNGVTLRALANGNGVQEYNGIPQQAATGYTDIYALTDKLRQQQEAERAKFERKRMADRISRMGFALGNLVGAGGGKTDASAITLDDGTKQVGEYRKDMEEINKQNMDAYQRALNLIYHKEEQDNKNAVREETAAQHEFQNRLLSDKFQYQQENDKVVNGIRQQNAETAAKRANTSAVNASNGAKNAATNAARENRLSQGTTRTTSQEKQDEYGNTSRTTTTTTTTPGGSSANGGNKGPLYTTNSQQKPKGNGKKLYDYKQQK